MADVTVKRLEDFQAGYGGAFVKVRAGLGVTSFGVQVLKLPPGYSDYPEHDHSEDGQEEVYTALEGAATLTAGGQEHRLAPGVFARVGPGTKRKVTTGGEGCRLLCLGGTPGKAYTVQPWSEEGAGE